MRLRISIRGSVRWSVGLLVGRSVTLSLKLRKTAEFIKNHGSRRERTTNQGSGSINESGTQSITHSNHSYMSQGASSAYVGLVRCVLRRSPVFLVWIIVALRNSGQLWATLDSSGQLWDNSGQLLDASIGQLLALFR